MCRLSQSLHCGTWVRLRRTKKKKEKPPDHTRKTTTKPYSFRPLAKQSSIARYTTNGQTVVNHSALQMESTGSPEKHKLYRTRWKTWDTKTRAAASDKTLHNCITLHQAITLHVHVQQSWKGQLKSSIVLSRWENTKPRALRYFVFCFFFPPSVSHMWTKTGNAVSAVWSDLL